MSLNRRIYPESLMEMMRKDLDIMKRSSAVSFGEIEHPSIEFPVMEFSPVTIKQRMLADYLNRHERSLESKVYEAFGYQLFGTSFVPISAMTNWDYLRKLKRVNHPYPKNIFELVAKEFEIPSIAKRSKITTYPGDVDYTYGFVTNSSLSYHGRNSFLYLTSLYDFFKEVEKEILKITGIHPMPVTK